MGKVFGGLFGNNDAKKQAEKQRQAQEVANTRQLAELNRSETRAALTRRNPRGRRLFSDAAAGDQKSSLA